MFICIFKDLDYTIKSFWLNQENHKAHLKNFGVKAWITKTRRTTVARKSNFTIVALALSHS